MLGCTQISELSDGVRMGRQEAEEHVLAFDRIGFCRQSHSTVLRGLVSSHSQKLETGTGQRLLGEAIAANVGLRVANYW